MELCTYCGEIATTRDHVIPVCHNSSLSSRKRQRANKKDTVPACHECNCIILKSINYFTVIERAKYVSQILPKRYEKLLLMPDWDEHELKELSNEMQGWILQQIKDKHNTIRRIKYSEMVAGQAPEDGRAYPASMTLRDALGEED